MEFDRMKSSLLKVGTVTILASSLFTGVAFAETETTSSESVSVINAYENLPFQVRNEMLTNAAIAADIPPEVVKAIAWGESKGWMQYINGAPHIGVDGKGIGIMQVTDYDPTDLEEVEKLKTDINYNIKRGIEILNEKYDWIKAGKLPKVAGADRHTIENWYFPVMAYNGIVSSNSPVYQKDGNPNKKAYQEGIFVEIEKNSYLDNDEEYDFLGKFNFSPEDFNYVESGNSEIIDFQKKEYTVNNTHQSAYFFEEGDHIVTTTSTNLRESNSRDANLVETLKNNTKLTVTGPLEYETGPKPNQFAFYPVQTEDGKKGYITTAYIQKAPTPTPIPTPTITFPDVVGDYKEAVDFLVSKGIKGKIDGTFGTHEQIKRVDAAVFVVKALGLDIENAPPSGFTDVEPRAEKEVNALKAAGITNGKTETTFGSNQTIRRGELAKWLTKAYDLKSSNEKLPFKDVEGDYIPAVSALVNNGITKGTTETTFGTHDLAKRGDFAKFVYRAAQASAE